MTIKQFTEFAEGVLELAEKPVRNSSSVTETERFYKAMNGLIVWIKLVPKEKLLLTISGYLNFKKR